MTAENSDTTAGAIAVVGLSGRFPGAPDIGTFWQNLRGGVESIRRFTEDELRAAGESEENLRDPAYVRACPQLEGVADFDATFFGISPRDAAAFDPQHRFFLECAWEAFEHAGYVGERLSVPVGVFASCGASEYMFKHVLNNAAVKASMGEWLIRHTGNDANFLATRVSYELDLRGPSMNVQTACSSSLVAIHLACQSLLNGECDLALAGGSTISPEQNKGYLYKEGEILSPDGHCRAFDAKSSGTLISSATGCVVLKRLADALQDGDNVLAVVRGSAINNDGNDKVGYLAPSVSGQARVVAEALAVAGVDARDVSYVEAHGTATLIGDPIELAGLTQAFRQSTDDCQFCAIGSLKTNIGHAGEAAGVAGFIKTVLALVHEELPPSLHYESPNPQAQFPSSPFFVNASLRPWTRQPSGKKRIAGVTGLGAGGTNAHVLLEEAPPQRASGPARAIQVLTISAKTKASLDAATQRLATHLRANPNANLADIAYTLLAGRKAFRHRRALACATVQEAIAALDPIDPRVVATQQHKQKPPSIVFMFPGGGAQYAAMGRGLYESEPAYRRAIDACAAFISPRLGRDLRELMYPARTAEASAEAAALDSANLLLERPSFALPAIFATEYAVCKLLESWGVKPDAMIGHSAGEYVAACLSGVLTMHDALALVALRGRLFETVPEGGMLSISLSEADVRARMPAALSIAANNADSLCVASGPLASIAELEAQLKAEEIDCTRVRIDVAAHSSMLDPILAELGAFCRTMRFSAPKIPYVSNLTGTWITDAQATDSNYWVRHLRESVRFGEGIQTLLTDPNRVLLEVGPGRTLSSLARMASAKPQAVLSSLRHPKEQADDLAFLLGAVAKMWAAGIDLAVTELHAGEARVRVALPSYAFDRQRYWIDEGKPSQVVVDDTAPLRKCNDVSNWFYTPSWRRAPTPRATADQGPQGWLVIMDRSLLAERLIERLRKRGHSVTVVKLGGVFVDHGTAGFSLDATRRSDWDALIDVLRMRGPLPRRIVHAVGLGPLSWRNPFRGPERELESLEVAVRRDYLSLIGFAQACVDVSEHLHLTVLTSGVHAVQGERDLVSARALLHGAARVIPRELPHFSCVAIDVDIPTSLRAEARWLERLEAELQAPIEHSVVALRGGERWLRSFDPIRLDPSPTDAWAREEGVYLITGGLGGIGMAVAEHLVRAVQPTLVLIGRTPLPAESEWDAYLASRAADPHDPTSDKIRRVRAMRNFGAEVMVASADVTDLHAMQQLVARVKAQYGAITCVFHAAGVLRDVLIANRSMLEGSDVIDTKVKGAVVLDTVLAREPLELFVLFSSVSSILGLPGQADYTAANAFLDSFAHGKAAEGHTRAVVVNWNAWQEVGMVAALTRVARTVVGHPVASGELPPKLPTGADAPLLFERSSSEGEIAHFATEFSRARHWLLSEHVVRGGEALIPGTGFVELAREAACHGGPPGAAIEIRDLFFLAPFVLRLDQERVLHAKLDRTTQELTFYSASETAPHATARVTRIDATPAPHHDLSAIRRRCTVRSATFHGFLPQSFMDFGPRWGVLRRADYGASEALLELELPRPYLKELDTYALHPALLDIATGGAQALIPGFSEANAFFVPFSYGRILVRRGLSKKLFSHVRYRSSGAEDLAIFDVTLCDSSGEELAQIEGFAMRRIAQGSEIASKAQGFEAESAVHGARRGETFMEMAMKEGILPSEGLDALDRILGAWVAPQLVASSVDLHRFVAKTDREAGGAGAARQAAPQFERPHLGNDFVAPRTPIERELAKIWGELLGVEQVGIEDDFFELGGQSLIAVRLFARLRKRNGIELPLATLFEAPNIAACASVIAERLGVTNTQDMSEPTPEENGAARPEPGKFRSLVMVQRGTDRTPFFCVHGAGGNVLNFRDLARAMSRAQPFYGLQARGIDGVLAPQASIEEMSRSYLEEIRGVQPHGPYLLGGYSGGGIVALEMAQLLAQAGDSVAMLVLLDTYHPQMPMSLFNFRTRIERLREEKLNYVREALHRTFVENKRVAREDAQIAELVRRGEPMPAELRDRHLSVSFGHAASQYIPKPWSGEATLLRAEDVSYVHRAGGAAYAWDKLMRVHVVQTPGNHATLLLEPNASVLVRTLGALLERAQQSIAKGVLQATETATR